jgi:hypothetical protein
MMYPRKEHEYFSPPIPGLFAPVAIIDPLSRDCHAVVQCTGTVKSGTASLEHIKDLQFKQFM